MKQNFKLWNKEFKMIQIRKSFVKKKRTRFKKNYQTELIEFTTNKKAFQCNTKNCMFNAKHLLIISKNERIALCSQCFNALKDMSKNKKGKKYKQTELKKYVKETRTRNKNRSGKKTL